jgi:hypothetical protein
MLQGPFACTGDSMRQTGFHLALWLTYKLLHAARIFILVGEVEGFQAVTNFNSTG